MNPPDMALPGTVIFAKDVRRVAEFYLQTLGLDVFENKVSHQVLRSPTFEIVVHGIPAKVANTIRISDPPVLRSETVFKPAFPVKSLKHVRGAATKTGGGLNPESSMWEIRGFRVLDGWDPEGNLVQFKSLNG